MEEVRLERVSEFDHDNFNNRKLLMHFLIRSGVLYSSPEFTTGPEKKRANQRKTHRIARINRTPNLSEIILCVPYLGGLRTVGPWGLFLNNKSLI